MTKITKWSVGDFKALARASMDVSPLSVLTGANSSGKSSVLQSLLLVGQSFGWGPSVVLNGPLVRLGRPVDVIRRDQKNVEFSFEVNFDASSPVGVLGEAKVSIALAADETDNRLIPVAFEVVDSRTGITMFASTSSRMSAVDVNAVLLRAPGDTTVLRVTTIAGRRAPNRMYVLFSGLMPTSLAVHRDKDSIERTIRTTLTDYFEAERFPYEALFEVNRLVSRNAFINAHGLSRPDGLPAGANPRWTAKQVLALSPEQFEDLLQRAVRKRTLIEWAVFAPESYRYGYVAAGGRGLEGMVEADAAATHELVLEYLGGIGNAISEFGQEIAYLGPLRDEPRVVHGAWDERVQSLPVGAKGELTAEVLTRRKDDLVQYYNWDGTRTRKSLPGAVADWCRYFGLGDYIKISDHGKLGRGVELRVNGVFRDLTTIGVGASQLLPVLVAGLSVPRGSTLLVEQPELHLHPQVQSRLADFFLRARPDVRFIVETHSEYLITRLRRRVAEGTVSPGKVQVLFAEQSEGNTNVRRLSLSELGDFSEWPEGFFDAQDEDSLGIVRAVAARLREEAGE